MFVFMCMCVCFVFVCETIYENNVRVVVANKTTCCCLLHLVCIFSYQKVTAYVVHKATLYPHSCVLYVYSLFKTCIEKVHICHSVRMHVCVD
jgi:hypothetical protein